MQTVDLVQAKSENEMQAELARVIALVEQGQVEEARELAPQVAARWPEAGAIQHMARVLEPPRVIARGGPRDRDRAPENAWLKAHAREYPGCWLAVLEDRLLAAGPRFGEVLQAARAAPGGEEAILFYSPNG